MKQIDKDLIIIGCIANLYGELGKNIKDIIPEYSGLHLARFAEKQPIYETDEATDDAIKELANECYNRIAREMYK